LNQRLGTKKQCMLVVNKADYLTRTARQMWAQTFERMGIDFVFWSAVGEQKRIEREEKDNRRKEAVRLDWEKAKQRDEILGAVIRKHNNTNLAGYDGEEEEDKDEGEKQKREGNGQEEEGEEEGEEEEDEREEDEDEDHEADNEEE